MAVRKVGRKWCASLPMPWDVVAWAARAEDGQLRRESSDGIRFRVVSWNVAYRVGPSVARQAAFLAELEPHLVLFQELNRRSSEALIEGAGLDWVRCAVDLRQPQPGDTPVRRRGVGLAGRGPEPSAVWSLQGVQLPERTLVGTASVGGIPVTVASYHAPPGVSWGLVKPAQAVACAHWLAGVDGPVILGADANTPELDMPDFSLTRTHWHSGRPKLKGAPGDDLLFGPGCVHGLSDALRVWLNEHPDDLARVISERPRGPLALSHRTGKRKSSLGTDRRFDAIWVSRDFKVDSVTYPYDESMAAGSDHSAVVADLVLEVPAAAGRRPSHDDGGGPPSPRRQG